MIIKNQTPQAYRLTIEDAYYGTPNYANEIVVKGFSGFPGIPLTTIPGDRIKGLKAQLDPLVRTGKLVIVQEHPFDEWVFRSTTSIPGLGGLDQFIPRYLDTFVPPSGSGNVSIEAHTLTGPEVTAKTFDLSFTPVGIVSANVYKGGPMLQDIDFTITGVAFDWTGSYYDGVFTTGDRIVLIYNT